MTERFSQEYIEFVTQSKPIQAHWQKRGVRVGDWALICNTDIVGLVVEIDVTQWEYTVLRFEGQEGDFNHRVELRWLPALSDLLQMLEKAGCECIIFPQKMNKWHDRRFMACCPEMSGFDRWIEQGLDGLSVDRAFGSDRELAAARLTERVPAGKEESDEQ